jgi:hypothetical protein
VQAASKLRKSQEKVANLAVLYTMINQMRLYSSPEVVEEAEKVIQIIVNTYLAPNKTFQDSREVMTKEDLDPLRPFSEAGRRELLRLWA